MYAVIASQALKPRILTWLIPAVGAKAAGNGACVTPSDCTKRPRPPETLRTLVSKLSIWSTIPDQLSARCCVGSPFTNVACNGTVRLGPEGKIHTELSLSPLGWHTAQDPQPLFDILPVRAGWPGTGGSKTPTDVLNNSRPAWILSSVVPACGRAVEDNVATTFSGD